METTVVFGFGLIAVVYWLIAHAGKAGLLSSNRAKFLANGTLWLGLVGLYAKADGFKASLFFYVTLWLGGWVATLLFKAGAKDNERTPQS